MRDLLLWEKFRPQSFDEIVLPDRIMSHFSDGIIKQNYIFYGSYGLGKTTLARILTKNKAVMEINSSLYTSIDVLRNDIDKFCKTVPMFDYEDDGFKYVLLEEFERVSASYQDAMKAFIEHYDKNVRFILTTNDYNAITDGVKSRFCSLSFNPENRDEEVLMKRGIYKRLLLASEVEGMTLEKDVLINIVNSNFPDLRSMFVTLQSIKYSGADNIKNNNIDLFNETVSMILTKDKTYNEIYHFVHENYANNINILFDMLGTKFINLCIEKGKLSDLLFDFNYIITEHHHLINSKTDPVILGMSVIGKYRKLIFS